MEPKNTTTLVPTPLTCLNQRVSIDLKNQTSIKHPIQAFIGDGLYVFGLIGIFILLKTLVTLNTMLENKPDDHAFMIFSKENGRQDTTLVRQIAKALENVECSTPLPVMSPSSSETFSLFASSPPPISTKGSCTVFMFDRNPHAPSTSTPISSIDVRSLFSSSDSTIKSFV